MVYRNLISLLFLLGGYSCTNNNTAKQQTDKHFDVTIENGQGQGFVYSDILNDKYFCRHFTTNITNNSVAPIHVKISLANQYYYLNSKDSLKSKVFILPRELVLNKLGFDNLASKAVKSFLDVGLPVFLDKIITPKENYAITFGTLTKMGQSSVPDITLISKENESTLSLSLKLESNLKSSPLIIPCGQITFAN
jgi:hypothetical protein